jgi:hypothetical protein
MLIRIEAHDLPGTSCGPSLDRPDDHHGIHAGVEAKNRPAELMGRVRADWTPSAGNSRRNLGLTDGKGYPTCAAVRPPLIEWRSAAA